MRGELLEAVRLLVSNKLGIDLGREIQATSYPFKKFIATAARRFQKNDSE